MDFATSIIAGGLLVPLLAWIFFWRASKKAAAAAHWPMVQGTITRSEVQKRRDRDIDERTETRWMIAVAYDYQAQGRRYSGKRIGFGANALFGSETAAKARLAPYGVGARVPVRFNPDKPEEAVLEAARPAIAFPIIVSLASVVFVGVGLILRFALG